MKKEKLIKIINKLVKEKWNYLNHNTINEMSEFIIDIIESKKIKKHIKSKDNIINNPQCQDCGLEYGGDSWIEAVIPDKVWKQISPHKDEGGILCISCIAGRLRELGYIQGTVPVWLCGTDPLVAKEGDPEQDLELLRKFEAKI